MTRRATRPTRGDIRHGFVYERVPHITLKSIANNAEIDVIWERYQAELEPLRAQLNAALGRSAPSLRGASGTARSDEAIQSNPKTGSLRSARDDGKGARDDGSAARDDYKTAWEEWQIPREADPAWPDTIKALHKAWWEKRIARQKEIDASIAAKAEVEYLYDKP